MQECILRVHVRPKRIRTPFIDSIEIMRADNVQIHDSAQVVFGAPIQTPDKIRKRFIYRFSGCIPKLGFINGNPNMIVPDAVNEFDILFRYKCFLRRSAEILGKPVAEIDASVKYKA